MAGDFSVLASTLGALQTGGLQYCNEGSGVTQRKTNFPLATTNIPQRLLSLLLLLFIQTLAPMTPPLFSAAQPICSQFFSFQMLKSFPPKTLNHAYC